VRRLAYSGITIMFIIFLIHTGCGGGGGDGDGGDLPDDVQKLAVIGDTSWDGLAYFLGGEGLEVDNYHLRQDSSFPAIAGSFAVWQDHRTGNWDIYARNVFTRSPWFRVNQDTSTDDQRQPAINGDYVAWVDYRKGERGIYARNISTMDPEFRVDRDVGTNSQSDPVIHGKYIVWVDDRKGNFDIYARNISTMDPDFRVNQDTGTNDQYDPAIHGDYVVWYDTRNTDPDIYARNITTMDQDFRVNQDTGTHTQASPAIHSDYVAWVDNRNGNLDIYARNISTMKPEFRVDQDTVGARQYGPSIYGDHIVWYGFRNEVYADIYLYSISWGTEHLISTGKNDDFLTLPSNISAYSLILFGDELIPAFALDVFDAADAAGVNMLGIGAEYPDNPLGYILVDDGRFGILTTVENGNSDMEIDVTVNGQGHPIFEGIDTSGTIMLESGGFRQDEQYYETDPMDPDSPSDWTELAVFGSNMGYAGTCAIVEFTTPGGARVILDGSANTYDEYEYWTQTRWDLLYNEVVYLMDN